MQVFCKKLYRGLFKLKADQRIVFDSCRKICKNLYRGLSLKPTGAWSLTHAAKFAKVLKSLTVLYPLVLSTITYPFHYNPFHHTSRFPPLLTLSTLPLPPYLFQHTSSTILLPPYLSTIPLPPYLFHHTTSTIPLPPYLTLSTTTYAFHHFHHGTRGPQAWFFCREV
jgi:hypothetical protein